MPSPPKVPLQLTDTLWPVYLLTDSACIWCHIILGKNPRAHSSPPSYKLHQIRDECLLSPTANKTLFLKRRSRAAKQRSDSLFPRPRSWIDGLECFPFFFSSGGGQNKFQACLCWSEEKKNQLNTKVERRTKASFSVPPQADNRRDGEHPMHNRNERCRIWQFNIPRAFVVGFKERSFWADAVDQGKRTTLDRWKLLPASWQVLLSVTLPFVYHTQGKKEKKRKVWYQRGTDLCSTLFQRYLEHANMSSTLIPYI